MLSKLYSAAVVLSLFILAPFFNLIYIQKVRLSKFSVTILKSLNNKIIFDFDDAIYMHQNIIHLLRAASCVAVSNDYLKEVASKCNNRIYKLISPVNVNTNKYFAKKNDRIILGWIGSLETSRYLNPLIPVLKSLTGKFKNLKIIFMGAAQNKEFESAGIEVLDWSLESENKYLEEIDIGIMPLADDEWSRAKGGYKLLQYIANNVSCVASPVGINKEVIRDGINGFLANTPTEWLNKLSLLIQDASLRQKMGREGLRLADELYSYRVTVPQLIEILKKTTESR